MARFDNFERSNKILCCTGWQSQLDLLGRNTFWENGILVHKPYLLLWRAPAAWEDDDRRYGVYHRIQRYPSLRKAGPKLRGSFDSWYARRMHAVRMCHRTFFLPHRYFKIILFLIYIWKKLIVALRVDSWSVPS